MCRYIRNAWMYPYHILFHPHSGKGKPIIKQKRINGYSLLVLLNHVVGCRLYCFDSFEREETVLISRLIKDTDICLDIGANIGYYTVLLCSKASKGEVHSFEPIPLNYHLMYTSCLINGFKNVVLNCCAAGSIDGDRLFTISEDNCYSSFIDTNRSPVAENITVSVMKLDTYCQEHDIDRIDFMKVDVEGAEKLVLDGAAQLLHDEKRKPKLVLMELYAPMLEKYSASIDEIVNFLKSLNYFPFIYVRGRIIPFRKQYYNRFYNVFFTLDHTILGISLNDAQSRKSK